MTGLRFTTLNHPSDNAFYQAGLTRPRTDCRFVSLAHHPSFFGQDLNQIFTLQSTQVSSKLILARWKGSKVIQLPTRGGSICFHTGVELMASFSSVLSVLSIGNNILLTRESKFPYSNAQSVLIWQLQVYVWAAAERTSPLLRPAWFMCVVKISQVFFWPIPSHWTQNVSAWLLTLGSR